MIWMFWRIGTGHKFAMERADENDPFVDCDDIALTFAFTRKAARKRFEKYYCNTLDENIHHVPLRRLFGKVPMLCGY